MPESPSYLRIHMRSWKPDGRTEEYAAASSIQISLTPELLALPFWELRHYIVGRVASEMERYAVDEMLSSLGNVAGQNT